jgi:peptide/nickel transport system permease protein
MGPFVLRRVLLMIPTFFGITLLTFAVMQLVPGDPFAPAPGVLAEGGLHGEAADALRAARGLDRPLLVQYAEWVGRIVTLDFGRSFTDGRRVTERLAEALPRTLLLAGLSLALAYLLAVPLGTLAAVRKDRLTDRLIGLGLFVLYSVPSFWLAILLLLFLAGGSGWALFPLQGLRSEGHAQLGPLAQAADLAWHLVLPVAVLTVGTLALVTRHVRSALLEVIRQDFIRTARAKGLSARAVVFRHGLRNSLLPIVTLFGLMLPQVVGGSVLVEQIFGIPGMGQLALQALLSRDYPTVMGVTTLVALLTMGAMLLTDLLYAWVDPRLRRGVGA